jgi:hypothetical protein
MAVLEPFGDGEKYYVCRCTRPPTMLPHVTADEPDVPDVSTLPTMDTVRGSAAGPPAVDDLRGLILRRFPFNVAVAYGAATSDETPVRARVGQMLLAYRGALQVSTCVLLAHHLRSSVRDEEVLRTMRRLAVPNLDAWFDALTALAAVEYPAGRRPEEGGPFAPELTAAVRGFQRLRRGGQLVHAALRSLAVRVDQGSRGWDEQAWETWHLQHLPFLAAAMEAFAPLSGVELLRGVEGTKHVALRGADAGFTPEPFYNEELRRLFQASDIVARTAAGALLPLYPLAVVPEALNMSTTDEVLLLDGFSPSEVVYSGVFARQRRPETRSPLTSLFAGSQRATGAWNVAAASTIEQQCRRYTAAHLDALTGARYHAETYLERPSVDEMVKEFLEHSAASACIVAGDAGSGRVSLLCRLAGWLASEQREDAVLLIAGTGYDGRTTRQRILGALELPEEAGLNGLVQRLHGEGATGRLICLVEVPSSPVDPDATLRELDDIALELRRAGEEHGVLVKIVCTVDQEALKLGLERWNRRHQTAYFAHGFCLHRFPGEGVSEGQPYLAIPPLLPQEAARVYAWVGHSIGRSCPTPWEQLPDTTRETLRSPLGIKLFHTAFGGVSRPGPVDPASLWDAFIDRLSDPVRGRSDTMAAALDVVDFCLDQGDGDIGPLLCHEVQLRWAQTQGGSPAEMASSLGPFERLSQAELLTVHPDGTWRFRWSELASHLARRALDRRSEWLDEETWLDWLGLPCSSPLDAALVPVGARLWKQERFTAFGGLLPHAHLREQLLLARVVELVAPRVGDYGLEQAVEGFRKGLDAITAQAQDPAEFRVWRDLLTWGVRPLVRARGSNPVAEKVVLEVAATLNERLAILEPEEIVHLRDLVKTYQDLGRLEAASDPKTARTWLERGADISRRLADLEALQGATADEDGPKSYLRDITRSYKALGPMVRKHLDGLDPEHKESLRALTGTYARLGDQVRGADKVKARSWYAKELVVAERLVDMEPDNTIYLTDLGNAYQKLAQLDARADRASAKEWVEKQLDVGTRLLELHPSHLPYMRNLAICYTRMGELEEPTLPQGARQWFERALDLRREVVNQAPEDPECLRELANSLHRMGRLDRRLNPGQARGWFEEDLSICQRLVSLEPENPQHLRSLSIAYYRLGELELDTRPEAARAYFERDVSIAERLVELRPGTARPLRDLLSSYRKVASLAEGEPSRPWLERALGVIDELIRLEPDNPDHRREMARTCRQLGELDMSSNVAAAQQWFARHVELTEHALQFRAGDPKLLLEVATSCAHLARLCDYEPGVARQWAERGLGAVQIVMEVDPDEPRHLKPAADLYGALADMEVGNPAVAHTWLHSRLGALESLAELEPAVPRHAWDIAHVCDRLAEIDRRRDPDSAARWLNTGLKARTRLVPLDTEPDVFVQTHAALVSRFALTGVHAEDGEAWLDAVLDGLQTLVAADPKNAAYQRDLAACQLLKGDVIRPADPDAARKLYDKGLARLQHLAASDHGNGQLLVDLAHVYRRLELFDMDRRPSSARQWAESQVRTWEKLVEAEPENTLFLGGLAQAYEGMGHQVKRQNPAKAVPWFTKGMTIRTRLAQTGFDI